MSAHPIAAAGAAVKLRRPWAVALLSLVPVYWQVWYYRINREMRDYGRAREDSQLAAVRPWLSVLATTVGMLLIVPPAVSLWRTVRRIERCERYTGPRPGAGVLIAVLVAGYVLSIAAGVIASPFAALGVALTGTVLWLIGTAVAQRHLNTLA
jgi:hypothetical protein